MPARLPGGCESRGLAQEVGDKNLWLRVVNALVPGGSFWKGMVSPTRSMDSKTLGSGVSTSDSGARADHELLYHVL